MKFSLEISNSRFRQTKDRISKFGDRTIEIIQSEKQKEKNEQNLRDLGGSINWIIIH